MRLFVLLSRFPFPLEKGDKLRAFHQIRILSEHHKIFLCALHEKPLQQDWIDEVSRYCKEVSTIRLSRSSQVMHLGLGLLGSEPFQVSYFFQRRVQKKVLGLIAIWRPDAMYCQLLRTAKYVESIRNIPKIMDFQDAFSKGIERRLKTDSWYLRPALRSESKRLARYEQKVHGLFDHCTIISEQDRDQLPFDQRDEVTVVRNGVQFDKFCPTRKEKSLDVLFAGNMGYAPNIDGAVFLSNEVMPIVWKTIPQATLTIAGTRPSAQVRQCANNRVDVTGWVQDMTDYYARAKVFVAPMNIGTGLQNKLLEAMSMELPCITSELANNALKAMPEKEILIAASAADYARSIIALLGNPALADTLAKAGHHMVKEHFGWHAATQPLLTLFDRILSDRTSK